MRRRGIKEISMADLKGSKTEVNLVASFAGESQARNRYTYFAGQARKDGYIQIAQIFEETANQEKEHANGISKQPFSRLPVISSHAKPIASRLK